MNYSLLRSFSPKEKMALLKLLIKIACSDGEWSEAEKSSIKEFSIQNDLKCNGNFIKNTAAEDVSGILSEFETCRNLERGKSLAWCFAGKHGISPDFERSLLSAIDDSLTTRTRKIEFGLKKYIQTSLEAFFHPLGKEDHLPGADGGSFQRLHFAAPGIGAKGH